MRTAFSWAPLCGVGALLGILFDAAPAAAGKVCDESCQSGCNICGSCDPALTTCSFECESCYEDCKENCTYWDSTPLCNYLDRGIDDHKALTEDRHVVFQSNIDTLDDIDRMEFGLDLPATHCVDPIHGTPCADKSYSVEWFIDAVRLSVAGVPLFFEEKSPNDAVLMIAKGGSKRDGMVGWDRSELRANPLWGLSESEIGRWFDRLPLPDVDGNSGNPQAGTAKELRTLTGEEVGRVVEGLIGRTLAEANKSGDCAGKTYCDNAGTIQVYWRGAETKKATECDLGACPATAARLPSPWLEVQGDPTNPSFLLDADIDAVVSWPDAADCPGGPPCGINVDKGHYYTTLGSVSMQIEFGLECVPTDGGFSVRLARTDQNFENDGGLGGALIERFGESRLDDMIGDAANFDFPFVYPACPSVADLVTVGADGSLTFAAPPADPTARWFPSRRLIRYARWLAVAPVVPPRQALENYFGKHIKDIAWTTTLPLVVPSTISGPIDANQKRTFDEIEAALPLVVALGNACPGIDFAKVEIPPPIIDAAEAVQCAKGVASPLNASRCYALGQLKAFTFQSEVLQKCFFANNVILDDTNVVAAYDQLFQAVAEITEDLPAIESLLPVGNLEIDVRTGKQGASDGFAFVDFADPVEVSATTRASAACRNRHHETMIPDPYTYPACDDPEDPWQLGGPGCPCKDVVGASSEDGGFSDGAGSHLAHNLYGTGQYCDDGLSLGGNALVCGKLTQQSHDYPVCMECGVDTLVGCACSADSECQGIEAGLQCWGSQDDGGWPGFGGGGKCLPAPMGVDGREALEEMPWFCLDNCEALGDLQDWNQGERACIFRNAGATLNHGTCVDISAGGACMPGECEEDNMVCTPSGCSVECSAEIPCTGLGFPDTYVCDPGGHCVPPECGAVDVDFAYCQLFR